MPRNAPDTFKRGRFPYAAAARSGILSAMKKTDRTAPVVAISIRQPYAWLVANGHKPVENRTWRTHFRGRIAIHAGSKLAPDFDEACEAARAAGIDLPAELPLGGIVGAATLADCVESHSSEWFTGPFGFVMQDARPVEFRERPGALGIFKL